MQQAAKEEIGRALTVEEIRQIFNEKSSRILMEMMKLEISLQLEFYNYEM